MNEEQIPVDSGTVEVVNNPTPAPAQPTSDPAELAATTYSLYLPRFQMLVQKLSNKQLRRVLLAAIEHPLYDNNPKFTSDDERSAFALSTHLLEAKMAMIMSTMFSKVALDQVDWAKEQPTDNVPLNQEKEEENGKQEDKS